jgi:hypothetical protein
MWGQVQGRNSCVGVISVVKTAFHAKESRQLPAIAVGVLLLAVVFAWKTGLLDQITGSTFTKKAGSDRSFEDHSLADGRIFELLRILDQRVLKLSFPGVPL